MTVNMKVIVAFMSTLATIVILAIIVPSLGSNFEIAMPVNESSSFADAPSGGDLWNSGITSVTMVIGIAGILIVLGFIGLKLFGNKN